MISLLGARMQNNFLIEAKWLARKGRTVNEKESQSKLDPKKTMAMVMRRFCRKEKEGGVGEEC